MEEEPPLQSAAPPTESLEEVVSRNMSSLRPPGIAAERSENDGEVVPAPGNDVDDDEEDMPPPGSHELRLLEQHSEVILSLTRPDPADGSSSFQLADGGSNDEDDVDSPAVDIMSYDAALAKEEKKKAMGESYSPRGRSRSPMPVGAVAVQGRSRATTTNTEQITATAANSEDIEEGGTIATEEGAVTAMVLDENVLEEELKEKIFSNVATAEIQEKTPWYKQWTVQLLLGLLLVAVIVGVIGATTREDEPDEKDPTTSPTAAPPMMSPIPTSPPTLSDEAVNLLNFLQTSFPENQDALLNTTSPQYQAFLWLYEQPDLDYTADIRLQQYALAVFYYATGGDDWVRSDGWLEAWEPCQQEQATGMDSVTFGLDCLATNEIQEILLPSNNLQGELPPEFFKFLWRNMNKIDFSGNRLEGNLDVIFETTSLLEHLNLGSNQFRGSLPRSVELVSNYLKFLDLSENQLDGNLPTEIGSLRLLEELNLEDCLFTGPVPTEIGQLTSLKILGTRDVAFTGSLPSEIGNLSLLETLAMTGAYTMMGTIPESLYSLTKLTKIQMTRIGFHGSLSPSISQLTDLESLELGYQNLSGMIPTEIGLLTKLQAFRANSNVLWGSLPTEIGNLVNLRSVSLQNNLLSGTFPTELGTAANLKSFAVFDNFCNGTIPSEIGNLTNMDVFFVAGNDLTGPIPTELLLMTNLKVCGLHDNALTGTIPAEFFTSLPNLDLFGAGSQLEGTLPTEIGLATRLKELLIYGNEGLTGTIPTEVGLLGQLKKLALSGNSLTGTLPSEFGNLASVDAVFLQRNMLTGSIPSENLANLEMVDLLYLQGNDLEGTLDFLCDSSTGSSMVPKLFSDCVDVSCPCCSYCCTDDNGCSWTGMGEEGKGEEVVDSFRPRRDRAPGDLNRTVNLPN